MNHSFLEYRPISGEISSQRSLISFEEAWLPLCHEECRRSRCLFYHAHSLKFTGMVVGEHNRSQDLELNVCKTNNSAPGEELVQLQTPMDMNLERALEHRGR